jgi:menaquinone-dependent protoporphyrinogen oxidase
MSESGHRVLIAYASKYGTTGEVAEAIARTMCQQGAAADTMRIAEVRDLSVYDAVVIGGAIHYDKWMSEARHFVTANEDMLSTLPVAYFFTCGILAEGSEKAENKALRYAGKLEALSDQIKPVSIGRFAGALDYGKMNLLGSLGRSYSQLCSALAKAITGIGTPYPHGARAFSTLMIGDVGL